MLKLASKVEAVNLANSYANKILPQLHAVFVPLVGQVILKNDGFLKSVEKLLPELPNTNRVSVYNSSSRHSLSWNVKSCVNGDGFAYYHEAVIYIGELEGKVLKSMYPVNRNAYREDWKVEEVEGKRKEARRLKDLYDAAKSELYLFGE